MEAIWRGLAILGSRGFVQAGFSAAIDLYLAGEFMLEYFLEALLPPHAEERSGFRYVVAEREITSRTKPPSLAPRTAPSASLA
jgi:hypothetical protein